MKLPNSYTYRPSELPPMTDDIKSAIAEIQLSASTLIMQNRGHYQALTKLAEILADCLNTCEANLYNICIIPDGDGEEPVQRAIGLTDWPALEKQLLISTAVTSTVAIKVLAGIFNCDFEQAASHIRDIGQAEFGAMSPEQIERAVAELAKTLRQNPDGGVFQLEV
jgi:hypothetical protein